MFCEFGNEKQLMDTANLLGVGGLPVIYYITDTSKGIIM